ncbi:hypothetical protein KY330_01530 [Candidatus Woesearchaeota archaeon]|nr:hypothetical protein [Candidatus Woesearchaeota archaeon]
MINYRQLKEGWRILLRGISRGHYKKYKGNAKEICQQIVKDCWNGKYFQTSLGHFSQFYVRDFSYCVEGLLKAGYREEVKKTLEYALRIFKREDRITTTITPDGKTVNIFRYTPESVALMTRDLRVLNDKALIKRYKAFIEKEVHKAYEYAFDKEKGLLKKDIEFSSIKDGAKRRSSCYNNCMIAMLSNELNKLKFYNPFDHYDLKRNIKENFWNGRYFIDDLSGVNYVAGDAITFAFWTGVFDSKNMFRSCLGAIKRDGLDKPWPLKYTKNRLKYHIIQEIFTPNYEGNTLWMHLGACFLKVVKKYDKKAFKEYITKYTKVIEKNKNYMELFHPNGKRYKTLFYKADEGMLWAAMYLELG